MAGCGKEELLIVLEKPEKENDETQFDHATMYYSGEGVEQDYKEAVKWYRKAAKQTSLRECHLSLYANSLP